MNRKGWNALKAVLGLVMFGGLLLLVQWYYFAASPLTQQEVDRYIKTIESQTQIPGARHDLKALRHFLETDDGRPFYTVNLYQFYDQARYLSQESDGQQPTIRGSEAYDRFSQIMLRLFVRNAAHPVFNTRWVDAETSNWDRMVIVRYRSRRDIANLFASEEFAEASTHKWAALEKHERLLVQGRQIPELLVLSIALFLLLVLISIPVFRKKV